MRKTGRNELCPFGSGRKFKKCHLGQPLTEAKIPPLQDLVDSFRATRVEYCLAGNFDKTHCSGKIVKAHTLQRNGTLNVIADGGKVYQFVPDLPALFKSGGKIQPKLVTTKSASTITGFCSFHDKYLFQPVEDVAFAATPEQAFLLMYRAVGREVYAKRSQKLSISMIRNLNRRHTGVNRAVADDFTSRMDESVGVGLRDLEQLKRRMDKILQTKDFSDVQIYVVQLHGSPDFACSGAITTEIDFAGNQLQDLAGDGSVLESLSFSIIGTLAAGAAVFVWLKDPRGRSEAFIRSLHALPDSEIPHAITRFTFEFFENTFVRPTWWDGLTAQARDVLTSRIENGTDYLDKRANGALLDDGLRVATWSLSSRYHNVPGL